MLNNDHFVQTVHRSHPCRPVISSLDELISFVRLRQILHYRYRSLLHQVIGQVTAIPSGPVSIVN